MKSDVPPSAMMCQLTLSMVWSFKTEWIRQRYFVTLSSRLIVISGCGKIALATNCFASCESDLWQQFDGLGMLKEIFIVLWLVQKPKWISRHVMPLVRISVAGLWFAKKFKLYGLADFFEGLLASLNSGPRVHTLEQFQQLRGRSRARETNKDNEFWL